MRRKKWKNGMLAVMLMLCMSFSMTMTAFAADVTENPQTEEIKQTEETAQEIEETIPEAEEAVSETEDNAKVTYTHTYHTNIKVTANVTVKDQNDQITESYAINKESGFFKGGVADPAAQAQITSFENEILDSVKGKGSVTKENESRSLILDHFESSNIISGEGESVNKNLDVHEYRVYVITYDLIVKTDSSALNDTGIKKVELEGVVFNYNAGDAPQASAKKCDADAEHYDITYEYWEQMEAREDGSVEPVAFWYSDESKNSTLAEDKKITSFQEGKQYMYSIFLNAKGGYTFASGSDFVMTINGETVNARNIMNSNGTTIFAIVKSVRPGKSDGNKTDNSNTEEPKNDDSQTDNSKTDEPKTEEPKAAVSAATDSKMTGSGAEGEAVAAINEWMPTTPDERKRYAAYGKEKLTYTTAPESEYAVTIRNAMQGKKCFDSFETVLGNWKIGRTYNILPSGNAVYKMGSKVRITLSIPEALRASGREFRMICVTENGQPVILKDLDTDADTITFETDVYYAFALIYRDI